MHGLIGDLRHSVAQHLGGELAEGGIGVGEEALEAGAEVIVAGLAVGRFHETILGAFAVAGRRELAAAALVGE